MIKEFNLVGQYVHNEYIAHLNTSDPWEGKTLSHSAFNIRLKFSFDSFSDVPFKIIPAFTAENHLEITWILTGTNLGMIGEVPATKNNLKISMYETKSRTTNEARI